MYLDIGRKYDMEELWRDYKKASPQKKREIERLMHNMKSQTKEEATIRETMIRALRGRDNREVGRLSVKLRAIQQKRTNNKIQL